MSCIPIQSFLINIGKHNNLLKSLLWSYSINSKYMLTISIKEIMLQYVQYGSYNTRDRRIEIKFVGK